MRSRFAAAVAGVLALLAAIAASPATAADGPNGLELTIVNEADAPLACEAALAHWFSTRLGTIAAGSMMRLPLVRGKGGAVAIEVAAGDLAPLERIWCGRVGRAWETGGTVALPRTSPQDQATRTVVCRANVDTPRIRCQSSGR